MSQAEFDFLTPEFIKRHCVPAGIRVDRDIFPWRYLGWSDADFMTNTMHFAHGPVIPVAQKEMLLGVVRVEEQKLLEIYRYVAGVRRAQGTIPKQTQLELF